MAEMTQNDHKRGGKRKGAGRKPNGIPTKVMRVPVRSVEVIEAFIHVQAEMNDRIGFDLRLSAAEEYRRADLVTTMEAIIAYEKERLVRLKILAEMENDKRQLNLF